MSVFRRKLFNRGGYAHRGTGITSGLDTPRRGLVTGPGGYAGLKPEMVEPWMTFMGNLASGKSYKTGFGGAMDILGQATTATAPVLGKAIAAGRKEGKYFWAYNTTTHRYERVTEATFNPEIHTKDAPEAVTDTKPTSYQEYALTDDTPTKEEYGVWLDRNKKDESKPTSYQEYALTTETPTKTGYAVWLDRNVKKAEKERGIKKADDNRLHYTDGDKELVFPDIKAEEKALDAVKSIPRDIYDGLTDYQKLRVLKLGAEGKVTNVKITDIEGQTVMTWFEGLDIKKEILGKAPPEKGEDLTETEAAIEAMTGMLNQPKAMYQKMLEQYGSISGDTSDVFTQDDIDMMKQKAKNQLAVLKTTEKKVLSVEDQEKINLNQMLLETVVKSDVEKIKAGGDQAIKQKAIYNTIRETVKTFEPGFLVNPRLSIGKFVDLLSPESLPESLRNAMQALKIGNPVAGDVLEKLSARLTIRIAEGGAIPGNLNAKEFDELKNSGLPLWTTKDGMLIMADLYEREGDVNIAANRMLNEITDQQLSGEDKFSVTLPNGDLQTFDGFTQAVGYIEDFIVEELPKIMSGSEMFGTDDMSDRIAGLNRYDKDSLLLADGVVDFMDVNGKWTSMSALEAQEENRLFFSHFGDPDNPNPKHRNKGVYLFDTGDLWSEGDDGYNPALHDIGTPRFIFWAKVKS